MYKKGIMIVPDSRDDVRTVDKIKYKKTGCRTGIRHAHSKCDRGL